MSIPTNGSGVIGLSSGPLLEQTQIGFVTGQTIWQLHIIGVVLPRKENRTLVCGKAARNLGSIPTFSRNPPKPKSPAKWQGFSFKY